MTPRTTIAEAVCTAFHVTPEDLFSRRKPKTIAQARAAFSWIARHETFPRPSYPEIARWHGLGMDHTSVMYHIEVVERWIANNDSAARALAEAVDRFKSLMNGVAA